MGLHLFLPAPPFLMAITTNQYAIVLGLIAVIGGAVAAYWISRKYPNKKQKADPIYKAFFVWLLLLLGYGIVVLIGIRQQQDTKGDLKWLVIALIVLVLFYAVVSYFVARPIPSYKLWMQYVLPDVKRYWNAEPYVGQGYFNGMIFHKVVDINNNQKIKQYLTELGKPAEKVDVFYGQAYFGNIFNFLAVRNKYTGEDIMLTRPPILTSVLIQKFLGEELVSSFAPALNQYDTQEDQHTQQVIRR